jgi:hypothetical protein
MPNNLSHIALTVEISKILDQYDIIASGLEKDMEVYAEKARYAVDIKSDEPFSYINTMIDKIYGSNVNERESSTGIETQLTELKQLETTPPILRKSLEDYNIGDSEDDDKKQIEQDMEKDIHQARLEDEFIQDPDEQQGPIDDTIEIDEIDDSTLSGILSESTVDKMEKEASRRVNNQNDGIKISDIEVDGVNLQNFFDQLRSQSIKNSDNTIISDEYSRNLSLIAFTVETSKIISSNTAFDQDLLDDLVNYNKSVGNNVIDINGEEPYSTIKGIIGQADNSLQGTRNSLEIVQTMPNTPKMLRESISSLSETETETEEIHDVVEVEPEDSSEDVINNEFI